MTDKEFKRLKKKDFIEIIYELQKELEETKEELARVKRAKTQVDLIASLEAAKIEIQCMAEEAKSLESKLASLKEAVKVKEAESSKETAEQEPEPSEKGSAKQEEESSEEAPAEQEEVTSEGALAEQKAE